MDRYTKNALWLYWIRGDDEEVLTDDEFFDLEEENLCEGFKTYEDYKTTWYYEWNNEVPWVDEKPWLEDGIGKEPTDDICYECKPLHFKSGHVEWPTCNWREDGYCNEGGLPGMIRVGNMIYFQDYEWYEGLEDGDLKEETLKKAILEGSWRHENRKGKNFYSWLKESFGDDDDDIKDIEDYLIPNDAPYYIDEEEEGFKERRSKLLGIPYKKPPTFKSEKFEVIKYSFRPAEEYVAIREYEYDI
ncbi:hypothetical protein Tco_0221779 [Tanacetum coccineum]